MCSNYFAPLHIHLFAESKHFHWILTWNLKKLRVIWSFQFFPSFKLRYSSTTLVSLPIINKNKKKKRIEGNIFPISHFFHFPTQCLSCNVPWLIKPVFHKGNGNKCLVRGACSIKFPHHMNLKNTKKIPHKLPKFKPLIGNLIMWTTVSPFWDILTHFLSHQTETAENSKHKFPWKIQPENEEKTYFS